MSNALYFDNMNHSPKWSARFWRREFREQNKGRTEFGDEEISARESSALDL